MKLTKIKKIEYYSFVTELNEYLKKKDNPLSPSQYTCVGEYFYNKCPLYEFDRSKNDTNILYRLTTPLLILVMIILFLFMPIKWLITGKLYYEFDDNSIIKKWYKKTGLNI